MLCDNSRFSYHKTPLTLWQHLSHQQHIQNLNSITEMWWCFYWSPLMCNSRIKWIVSVKWKPSISKTTVLKNWENRQVKCVLDTALLFLKGEHQICFESKMSLYFFSRDYNNTCFTVLTIISLVVSSQRWPNVCAAGRFSSLQLYPKDKFPQSILCTWPINFDLSLNLVPYHAILI